MVNLRKIRDVIQIKKANLAFFLKNQKKLFSDLRKNSVNLELPDDKP